MATFPSTFCPTYLEGVSPRSYLQVGMPLDPASLKGNYKVPKTSSETGSPVFRNKICKETEGHNLVTSMHPLITTVYDVFALAVKSYASQPSIGTKGPKGNDPLYYSFAELGDLRDQFGSGLLKLTKELATASGEPPVLTLYAPNCVEWVVADLGATAYSIPTAPLFSTFLEEALIHILSLTESPLTLIAPDQVKLLLEIIQRHHINTTKVLIVTLITKETELDSEVVTVAGNLGISLTTFKEVCAAGVAAPVAHNPPTSETIFTISFTPGSSGKPKGVEVTHANAVATLTSLFTTTRKPDLPGARVSNKYRAVCCLPLQHIFQRIMCYFELCVGTSIYIPLAPTVAELLFADFAQIRPTHLIGVPCMFNRMEAELRAHLSSSGFMARQMYKRTVAYKTSRFMMGKHITNHWLYDRRFTGKIKQSMGLENVQMMISATCPMLPQTLKSLRFLLNTEMVQGYGMTESVGPVSMQLPGDELMPASSGFISVTTEFKVCDVPLGAYTWLGNRSGELYIRGPQVVKRYYKDPVRSRTNFSSDGWFRTGDIATIDSEGRIIVVDKLAALLSLLDGKTVSPGNVERTYVNTNAKLLLQTIASGNPAHPFLVGVVSLKEKGCLELLQTASESLRLIAAINEDTVAALNKNDEFKLFILKALNKNASEHLAPHELMRNITIFMNPESEAAVVTKGENFGFTNIQGLRTPTMQLRRMNAGVHFKSDIQRMFAQGALL